MRRPIWASVPATWWQVEVLPTPPFWFSIVMTGTVRFPPWVWATSVIDRPLHRAPDFVVPRAPGDDARCTGGQGRGIAKQDDQGNETAAALDRLPSRDFRLPPQPGMMAG